MENIDRIKALLKEHGLRITNSRVAVAITLNDNTDELLSSEEIHRSISESKDFDCDLASVYRSLAMFEDIGLIEKNIFQGDVARYKLIGISKKKKHEHYFKCNVCGVIKPFGGCFVHKKEKELSSLGYENLNHHLEITGTCPSCAKK